jgi:hypothetical protein
MPRGAPARKLAITVDADVHARVVRAARKKKVSISAWLTEAARRSLRIGDGLAAVAEWEAEHGAFSEEELEAARRQVRRKHPSPPPHRVRKR